MPLEWLQTLLGWLSSLVLTLAALPMARAVPEIRTVHGAAARGAGPAQLAWGPAQLGWSALGQAGSRSGEAVAVSAEGRRAWIERKGGRCELLVQLVREPPLRIGLPICRRELRAFWAGPDRVLIGKSELAPELSVRFHAE